MIGEWRSPIFSETANSAFERTLLFHLLAQPDFKSDRNQNDNQIILFNQTLGD